MYDMKNMRQLDKYKNLVPEAWDAFVAFDKAALGDGKLSSKTKELVAVAVALTTQCSYCIEIHTKRAKEAGNTDEEIAEIVMVAAALRAGAAVTHGTHCMQQ